MAAVIKCVRFYRGINSKFELSKCLLFDSCNISVILPPFEKIYHEFVNFVNLFF